MEICNNECTGCGMCSNICPKKAITMEKDKHGFLYPKINKKKCIECGICKNNCPSNKKMQKQTTIKSVYAAWNKNKKIRKQSSSGGIFTLLARKVISDGGIVVGVKWGKNNRPTHTIINDMNGIHELNGSKYVQSFTGNIYSEVKNELKKGKKVLFSGTPCQIYALKIFLNDKYKDIYYVDVICHGVPSQDVFDRYLTERMNESKSEIKRIYLRYKNPYWDYSNVRIEFENKKIYMKKTIDDAYFNLFNIGYSLRNSCHKCRYTNLHRHGDITLADFWGYHPKSIKMRNYLKGTSCILINTEKGKEMFDLIKKDIVFEHDNVENVIKNQVSLSKSFNPINNDVEKFWEDYDNEYSIEELNKKYIIEPFREPNLMWLRRIKYKYWWVFQKNEKVKK